MHLGDAKLGDKGDEGTEPSSLEPRVRAVVGVERCNLGKQANLGDKGNEGKEPSHHWGRVWKRWWVSRDATWESKQILVTRVTKANEPSSLGPRVGERRWGSRAAQVMQVFATRVTKAKSHHHWGRVWER
jgi:hypothetical protein